MNSMDQSPNQAEKEFHTPISTYLTGDYDGTNACGWRPVTDHVLVLPDQPMRRSKAGVIIPDNITERRAAAAESGIMIAAGPDAFIWNADRTRKLEHAGNLVGQRIVFNRYAGINLSGDDGQLYMMMVDRSIVGERDLHEQDGKVAGAVKKMKAKKKVPRVAPTRC
jgi:co-chaperonin GroES (HSP10)